MKCWAIRKLLPLYTGEGDLLIFCKSVEKHLQKCSACNGEYQAYSVGRDRLKTLNKTTLPSDLYTTYWQEFEAKLHAETPEKASPVVEKVSVSPQRLWPAFSFARFPLRAAFVFSICLIVVIIVAGPGPHSGPHSQGDIKPSSWFDILSGSDEDMCFKEYKIDYVRPCMQEEVSF